MRLLVFSDSHGSPYYMRRAMEKHPEADMIVFLGDGIHDLENVEFEIAGRPVVSVKGNCDFGSDEKILQILNVEGHRIYITHGFAEHVKYGIEDLAANARGYNADIVFFGHTHMQMTDYEDGMYFLNPGCAGDGYYGIADIFRTGVMLNTAKA